jgi:transposase
MKKLLATESSFFGVDVACKELVIARYPESQTQAIGNDKKSIRVWLKTLPANAVVASEATGSYHRTLIELAFEAGATCFVLNPKDVKHYASAAGGRAKTDAVDARLIARYCAKEHMELHAWKPSPAHCDQVLELLNRRAKLVKAHGVMTQSFKSLKGFADTLAKITEVMRQALSKLDAAIQKASLALPEGAEEMARLLAIPGVGLLTACYLASTFTRIPFANSDASVAFAGLDPRANDSGTKTGRRRLSKRGPSELRRLLYNAAMSGARTKAWNPLYQRTRDAGKTTTEALVILARKMLRIAFSLFKNKTHFDVKQLGASQTVST